MIIFLLIVIAIYFIVGLVGKNSNNTEIFTSLVGVLLPIVLMILIFL